MNSQKKTEKNMKQLYSGPIILLGSLLSLTACTDDNNPAQQYGNTMVQSYKKAKDVDNKINVQQVQKSIQEFYVANGKYPADLNELSTFNGITLKNDAFEYNPSTGTFAEKQ